MRTDNSLVNEQGHLFTDPHLCQSSFDIPFWRVWKVTSKNISSTLALLSPYENTVQESICSFGLKKPFQWAETLTQTRKTFQKCSKYGLTLIKQCHLFAEWQGHNFYNKNSFQCQKWTYRNITAAYTKYAYLYSRKYIDIGAAISFWNDLYRRYFGPGPATDQLWNLC